MSNSDCAVLPMLSLQFEELFLKNPSLKIPGQVSNMILFCTIQLPFPLEDHLNWFSVPGSSAWININSPLGLIGFGRLWTRSWPLRRPSCVSC